MHTAKRTSATPDCCTRGPAPRYRESSSRDSTPCVLHAEGSSRPTDSAGLASERTAEYFERPDCSEGSTENLVNIVAMCYGERKMNCRYFRPDKAYSIGYTV
ncbi:unnamed protein product [Arctogadus glacialis]